MLKLLLVFCLVIVQVWSFNFTKFGRGRMIGGELAAPGQFPYTVSLWDSGSHYICSGAFIDKNWILTAAHCVQDLQCVTIFLGVTDIYSEDEIIEMVVSEEVIIHPGWDEAANVNDIALIKTQDVYITENIFPVPLPLNVNYGPIEYAYLSSWGTLEGFVLPQRLQWSMFQIISNEECSHFYDGLTDNILCAYANPSARANAGDSGSPLVLEDTPALVGILAVSSGQYLEPIIFTRVSGFLDWIRSCTGII